MIASRPRTFVMLSVVAAVAVGSALLLSLSPKELHQHAATIRRQLRFNDPKTIRLRSNQQLHVPQFIGAGEDTHCHSNPPLPPPIQNARCALVANGPSLNKMPSGWGEWLNQEFDLVMGMNKIYLGLNRFNLTIDLHAAINPLVVEQSVEDFQAMCGFKFLRADQAHRFPCGLSDVFFLKSIFDTHFSFDLNRGVQEGWTVTFVSLQVLYSMGCTEVMIVGMDHTFAQKGKPNTKQVLDGPDPNHFDPSYFGGKEWHLADLSQSERHYHYARETYEADGRRIIDATIGGLCQIFEKVDFMSLYPNGAY